jgi:predicted NUDIX family NTP pyrophosphohydrolase
MTPLDGSFEPTPEVDRIEWLAQAEAAERLSYDRDREVLEAVDPG